MDRYPPASELTNSVQAGKALDAELAEWAVVNASLNVHLIGTNFSPTPGLLVADFTAIEATYTGYALKAVVISTFTLKQYQANGDRRYQSTTLLSWAGPTAAGPTTIYGYYLTEAGATVRLYRAFKLVDPVTLADDHAFFNLLLTITGRAGVQSA